MESPNEYTTWQQLLAHLIKSPSELKHLATALRVHPLTLQRWARGEVTPRSTSIRRLFQVLPPEVAHDFSRLAAVEWPELVQPPTEASAASPVHPPAEFYARLLSAYANTPPALFTQTLYDLLLQQALEQLDPERRGMSISIVRCIPPLEGQKILSLREVSGLGTPPWKRDLEQKLYFLGVESLAGTAVSHCRRALAQSREEASILYAIRWTDYEESAVAQPIFNKTRIAGCLLVASALPQYFTQSRLDLIECYANLFALAFQPHEFYDDTQLDLRVMPPPQLQEPYFYSFRQRVLKHLQQAAKGPSFMTLHEAQELSWQEIEAELLRQPPSFDE